MDEECPNCEKDVDFIDVFTEILAGWVNIEFMCPECQAVFTGNIRLDNMDITKVNDE